MPQVPVLPHMSQDASQMQDAIENLNKKLMGLTKSNSDLLQQLGEREKQIQKLGSLLAQGPKSTEKISFCLSFDLKNCLIQ